jgi:transaldolase/glucose-6-phosphate isomerase
MIKVPGTNEGLPAVEQLLFEGLNINITLLFSVKVYERVMEAYLRGLERRVEAGLPIDRIASVASFFVSRVDTAVDKLLEDKLKAETDPDRRAALESLLGKAAIANAKLAYRRFKETFTGPRWEALAAKGARVQRPLWASTSTKNPAYRDVLYVEELIGPDTVNTVPQNTWDAILDHAYIAPTIEEDFDRAQADLAALARHGIDLDQVTDQLTRDGVKSFADSFDQLLGAIAQKRAQFQAEPSAETFRWNVSTHEPAVAERIAALAREDAVARLWRRDPTLWKREDAHTAVIRNRLGWLTVADLMDERIPALRALVDEVRKDGFTAAVHMGMGGSSLAPDVLRHTFGVAPDHLTLHVLDTTDPGTVLDTERALELRKTLFLVASKSGTTLETRAHFQHFWARLESAGVTAPGRHFVAITDPGTPLETLARERSFRAVFANPPDIGGRYSALSYFGLVPAALIGLDLARLLDRADRMAHACAPAVPAAENPGLVLGAILGELARRGRDKVTFVLPDPLASFGYWLEQLIAESTGKEGTGLIPVEGEPLGDPSMYGDDRVFVYFRLAAEGDGAREQALAALVAAGHPVVTIPLRDPYDLGGEFFRWEFATAVAGAVLGVNPFDEPNVQESKDNTNRILETLAAEGRLPEPAPEVRDGDLAVSGAPGATAGEALATFLRGVRRGDYLALTAYLPMDIPNQDALRALRSVLRDRLGVATTVGFGPRYLHSTGQLHKGGPDSVAVLQFTAEVPEDTRIAGLPYTFGTLERAQALGDLQSLRAHNRRALRIHLGANAPAALAHLTTAIPESVPTT